MPLAPQMPPAFAILSIVAALLPLPILKLMDYLNRGCGDGSCGIFSGALILGGLAIATLAFGIKSARRGEAPAVLRLIPILLWALLLPVLTL